MTFLEIAFIVLAILAAFHFIYDGIIAPEIRHRLTFRLMCLQDRLHRLRYESPEVCPEAVARLLAAVDTWRAGVEHLHFFTLARAAGKYRHDAAFRARVDHAVKVCDACQHADFRAVDRELLAIAQQVVLINSAAVTGWLAVFTAPFLIIAFVFARVTAWWQTAMSAVLFSANTDAAELRPCLA